MPLVVDRIPILSEERSETNHRIHVVEQFRHLERDLRTRTADPSPEPDDARRIARTLVERRIGGHSHRVDAGRRNELHMMAGGTQRLDDARNVYALPAAPGRPVVIDKAHEVRLLQT